MDYTPKTIELFHLLFLKHLEGKLDKNLYALKGGANLRFFFKSIRYSEDIDFDVKIVSKNTLQQKITKLLKSQPFEQVLSSKGIEIVHLTEAKQTDTTQRWKLNLRVPTSALPLPTKIEFSRRTSNMKEETTFEAIDTDIIRMHQLYPILTNHYTARAAFCQKIHALISRTETQARDIFDLKWLIDQKINIKLLPSSLKIKEAIENVNSVGFSEFKGHVVAYLMPEYQEYYATSNRWQEIQTQVIHTLQKLQK